MPNSQTCRYGPCDNEVINDPHGKPKVYCARTCRDLDYYRRRFTRQAQDKIDALEIQIVHLTRVNRELQAALDGAYRFVNNAGGRP